MAASPAPIAVAEEPPVIEESRVSIILEDGTRATPRLDPDQEERLRYLVDNLVPPSTPRDP